MVVKLGDRVECEVCIGTLVACTKQWAIVRDDEGGECAIYLKDQYLSIPAEIEKEQSELAEIEVVEEEETK